MKKFFPLLQKYSEMINYLIFGFLSFLVNLLVYMGTVKLLNADNTKIILILFATAFAWIVSVFFAYYTNRIFVFKSKISDKAGVRKEFAQFVAARMVTGLMELVLMFVFCSLLNMGDTVAKLICNVVVIVTNYILSKIWIFKKTEEN